MKLKNIVAGLLVAVIMLSIGSVSFASAKAEAGFDFMQPCPVQIGVVTNNPEPDPDKETIDNMTEALKKGDVLKPVKDEMHNVIDDLDVGDPEKELLKSLGDAVLGTTVGTVVSVPGVGAVTRCSEAMSEMMAAKQCTNAEERAKHMQKAANLLVESAVTLLPGGNYILQGKKVVEAVGTYVVERADDAIDYLEEKTEEFTNWVNDLF